MLRLLRQSLEELEDLVREGSSSGELKAVDARFLQLAIAAMCEFFFSAHPIFQGIFGAEADDPSFVETYARFITTLVSEPLGKAAKATAAGKSRVRNGR